MPITINTVSVPDADGIDDAGTVNKFTTAADISKLAGIEAGATADQTDSEIETAYNNQVSVVSQAEAEAGTATTVRRWTALRVAQAIAALAAGGGGAAKATDNLSSGNLTVQVRRVGGSAVVLTNPATGEYTLTVPAGADVERLDLFVDNTVLNASQEFILNVDNSANSEDREFLVQLYDANNDSLVDQQATATVNTQDSTANVATLLFPGMNGFGPTGARIKLR